MINEYKNAPKQQNQTATSGRRTVNCRYWKAAYKEWRN